MLLHWATGMRAAHGLRAAGHRDVAVAELDRLGREHDRLQPAAAQPVNGEGWGFDREAAVDRCDPAEIHVAWLGMDHVAEDRLPGLPPHA